MKALPFLLASVFAIATGHAEISPAMAADFEWFDTLGFPDVKDLPFVRYNYGTIKSAEGTDEKVWTVGFLQEHAPQKVRILTLQFAFDLDDPHEPADLRAYAEDELERPNLNATRLTKPMLLIGPRFSRRTELFVLGWMCARNGMSDLASKLYSAAQSADGWKQGAAQERDWAFRDKLERDIGNFEMWRTVVAFGEPTVSRRELLARLRSLPKRFPRCDHLVRAESMAKNLEQMIAEDDTHPTRKARDIAGLSPAEQAKEWVFRLRDQNGVQFMQPGWVSVFDTPGNWRPEIREESPAHRLFQLGDAAVPALIAALDDPRLTRSVGYKRNFTFSHEVLTVGDASLEILDRIAGREFYANRSFPPMMSRTGDIAAVRALVQQWWEIEQHSPPPAASQEAPPRQGR